MRPIFALVLAALLAGCSYPHLVDKGKIDEPYFQRVADGTARTRGIPFEKPVPHEVISEALAREKLAKIIERDLPKGEVEAQVRAFEAIGFGKAVADPRGRTVALAAEQAAAFYDPIEKRFYVLDRSVPGLTGAALGFASWLSKRDLAAELVVSHELVHALQDSRYDIESYDKVPGNDDAELAHDAVVEGDATIASFRYLDLSVELRREDLLDSPGEAFEHAAPVEREALVFPYYGGVTFLNALAKAGAAARDPWREPPRSTAEVLHPEKYLKREKARALSFGEAAAPRGWRLLRENTLGELLLKVLLEGAKETKDDAAKLAAGWASDRYRVFENEKTHELALAWSIAFETADGARAFVAAYRKLAAAAKKTGEASIATLTGERQVAIVEAPDGATLFAIGLPVLLAR